MVTWRGPARERLFGSFPYPLGLAIFLVQIAIGTVLFAVFQEFVPSQLGAGDAWPGYMISAYGAARFLSETPTGAVTDRIERKVGLLFGFAFMVPAIFLMAIVQEKLAYVAFAALLGWGTAFVWPATYAISADLYPPERRGKVVGYLNVAQFLGFGAGALMGALLIERAPALVFTIAGLSVVLAFTSTQLGIPAYRRDVLTSPLVRPRAQVREVLSWQLAILSVLILGATVATAMIVPAIRPFGARVLEISFAKLTVLLIPSVVIGALLYIPAGHIGDLFGRCGGNAGRNRQRVDRARVECGRHGPRTTVTPGRDDRLVRGPERTGARGRTRARGVHRGRIRPGHGVSGSRGRRRDHRCRCAGVWANLSTGCPPGTRAGRKNERATGRAC